MSVPEGHENIFPKSKSNVDLTTLLLSMNRVKYLPSEIVGKIGMSIIRPTYNEVYDRAMQIYNRAKNPYKERNGNDAIEDIVVEDVAFGGSILSMHYNYVTQWIRPIKNLENFPSENVTIEIPRNSVTSCRDEQYVFGRLITRLLTPNSMPSDKKMVLAWHPELITQWGRYAYELHVKFGTTWSDFSEDRNIVIWTITTLRGDPEIARLILEKREGNGSIQGHIKLLMDHLKDDDTKLAQRIGIPIANALYYMMVRLAGYTAKQFFGDINQDGHTCKLNVELCTGAIVTNKFTVVLRNDASL
jgi:hypothetical protein